MSRIFYKFARIVYNETTGEPRVPYLNDELIRFTQPSQLNDPWECRPYALAKSIPGYNEIKNGLDKVSKLAKERQSILKYLDQRYGIFSLTDAKHSSAMWAHYARDHQGVCIGFDRDHRFFNPTPECHFYKPEPVRYRARPVEYDPIHKNYNPDVLYTKALEWAYEEEWRMVVDFQLREPDNKIAPNLEARTLPVYLYRVPQDAVREVIIGNRADKRLFKSVQDWAFERNINTYFSTPSDTRFEMEASYMPIKFSDILEKFP